MILSLAIGQPLRNFNEEILTVGNISTYVLRVDELGQHEVARALGEVGPLRFVALGEEFQGLRFFRCGFHRPPPSHRLTVVVVQVLVVVTDRLHIIRVVVSTGRRLGIACKAILISNFDNVHIGKNMALNKILRSQFKQFRINKTILTPTCARDRSVG
jgi:hypothetical protein